MSKKPQPQDRNIRAIQRAIAECERKLVLAQTEEDIESYTVQLQSLQNDLARYKKGMIPSLHVR